MLTVIIPFLNEGIEIENTLKSIRHTAGEAVDILLINDASTDGYDYVAVAEEYGATYLKNETRQGVARSRDIGVDMIHTPCFLLLDGHMRFYDSNWHEEIVAQIEEDPRAVYCCQCLAIDDKGAPAKGAGQPFGSIVNIACEKFDSILEPKWILKDNNPEKDIIDIPCILGAAYACSVKYWQYLGGLRGLRSYGCDEAYISIKAWMEGGSCKLLKHIVVGHIFRPKAPYDIPTTDRVFNKLLLSELFLPPAMKSKAFGILKQQYPNHFTEALPLLAGERQLLIELKQHLQSIRENSFDHFCEINERFQDVAKQGIVDHA